MECPEFRQLLLLLRPDLKDTMIPHRSKLRELIVLAWKEEFQVIKRDLAVCFFTLCRVQTPELFIVLI